MLDFRIVDADNHYYEATDAFTRHLEPEMAKRTIQWADIDGKRRLLVAGSVNRFIPNPTFSHLAAPGALADFFRARAGSDDLRSAFGELTPIEEHPEYRDRDARLAARLVGRERTALLAAGLVERDADVVHEVFAPGEKSMGLTIDQDMTIEVHRIDGTRHGCRG